MINDLNYQPFTSKRKIISQLKYFYLRNHFYEKAIITYFSNLRILIYAIINNKNINKENEKKFHVKK